MIRFKRGLAILLSTCMIGGMMPLLVSAEESVSGNTVQTESTEQVQENGEAGTEAIAAIQALIDALPDADSITEDNVENVTSQLDTIDEAKAELSDADISQLDLTRYDAAINKVMVLMGMKEENDSEIAVQANDSAGKTEQQSTDEAIVYQPAVETTDKYDIDDDGTKDTVYEISNAGQLYWFAGLVNGTLDGVEQNTLANAILTANITVNENLLDSLQYDTEGNVSNGSDFITWTPIADWMGNRTTQYSGTFDGNNKTVSGLYFNGDSTCIGLFGSSESDGNIKNVGVVDSYFKGNDHVGGVCGNNAGTITNCYNAGNLTAIEPSATIGGICGYNNGGTVTNCYNTGTVTATGSVASVGGVCGCSIAPISNCYNIGTVTATSSSADISGICGYYFGPIKNCYYLADTEDENGGKTTAQFASGEVAYLLSQGCTVVVDKSDVTYDGSIWGQKLGENGDTYPVLDITKRVYQVDKYDGCEGKPGSSTKVYSNQSTSIYEEHKYEVDTTDSTKHKCSICNGTEEHSFAYELVENGNAIKATCSECGATYTVKLTQPAAISGEKIVYNGIEKKAGTAIDSGNTGVETIPENAITYATVTNGTPSAYSTAAPKNAGTYKAKLTLGTGDNIVSIEINFTIEKAAEPTIAGEERSYIYSTGSDGKTISVDIAGKLPTDRGTTTYAVAKTDTEQLLSKVKVDTAGNLTYKVNQVDSSKIGKTAIITVTASMENYANAGYTLTISITDTRSECDHTHTEIRNQREATCTQTGYTGDTYCKDCDKLLSTGKELAALGHDYKATVTKQPTTTEEGVRTYTCTRCNSSYTESIAKLPEEQHTHNYTGNITKEATCTETGVRTYTCSCGDSYTESIPATGHSYVSKVTKAATTTEEGIMTYTCSKCGHSYTQPIAKSKSDDSGKNNGNENQNPKSDDNSKDNGSQNQKPQSGTDNGNQNQKPQTDTDNGKDNGTSIKPYIKDDSGKEGWDVIKPQLEEAKSGDTVTVVMNGTTVVPKDVIDSIKGKDTTLVLDMGNGLSWKIYGKDITDAAGDIDFDVTVGADAGKSIPVDVVNNVTGERSSMNLTLAYDGEFGFTATLAINMESKNAGLYANLFYYNEQTGELEFVSAGQIDADGNTELEFTHASDYTIVIDVAVMDGGNKDSIDTTKDNGNAEDNSTIPAPNADHAKSDAWNPAIIIIIGICILLIVSGVVIFARKKSGSEEE